MQTGYRIVRFDAFPTWKPTTAADWLGYSHKRQQECPACDTQLQTVVAMVSPEDRLDVVCCPTCGLITYDKLPGNIHLSEFYRERWMGDDIETARAKCREVVAEVDAIAIDYANERPQACLDVGCGYGAQLRLFQRVGHKRVHGVEACSVRAQAVSEVLGVPVQVGDFMTLDFQEPFDYLTSTHVLEHTIDPNRFIRKCRSIQPTGGRLEIQLPSAMAEPTCGQLFFFPHCYSFTALSLAHLFHKSNYIVDRIGGGADVFISGRQTTNAAELLANRSEYESNLTVTDVVGRIVNKVRLGLGLSLPNEIRVTWQKSVDGVSVAPVEHDTLGDVRVDRSMVVRPLRKFVTDAAIEIQFDDCVLGFFK